MSLKELNLSWNHLRLDGAIAVGAALSVSLCISVLLKVQIMYSKRTYKNLKNRYATFNNFGPIFVDCVLFIVHDDVYSWIL